MHHDRAVRLVQEREKTAPTEGAAQAKGQGAAQAKGKAEGKGQGEAQAQGKDRSDGRVRSTRRQAGGTVVAFGGIVIDRLWDIAQKLFGEDGVKDLLPGWKRLLTAHRASRRAARQHSNRPLWPLIRQRQRLRWRWRWRWRNRGGDLEWAAR